MTKLLTTSVVRGSHQGESHGGVYLIDLESRSVDQVVDWNKADIDWTGRGADRGLRGIAFDGETIYIAASDELFAYTPDFKLIGSWKNPYLKHCHEISIFGRNLFLSSTGYDAILSFDLDEKVFNWALYIDVKDFQFSGRMFDPLASDGPLMMNKLHLNSIVATAEGMYISGLRSGGMVYFNGESVQMSAELPVGTHNAQPFRDGVLFNDTEADRLRYSGRGAGHEDRAMHVPKPDLARLTHLGDDTTRVARPRFARGLCVISPSVVAGGSSPSTVSIYDLAENKRLVSINLSVDVRNAIHGLEVWPF